MLDLSRPILLIHGEACSPIKSFCFLDICRWQPEDARLCNTAYISLACVGFFLLECFSQRVFKFISNSHDLIADTIAMKELANIMMFHSDILCSAWISRDRCKLYCCGALYEHQRPWKYSLFYPRLLVCNLPKKFSDSRYIQVHADTAKYSDSPETRAITVCSLFLKFIGEPLTMKTYPVVDIQVFWSPTRSASTVDNI